MVFEWRASGKKWKKMEESANQGKRQRGKVANRRAQWMGANYRMKGVSRREPGIPALLLAGES
jgi:hypothetical protein